MGLLINIVLNIVKKLLIVIPTLIFLTLVIFSVTMMFSPLDRALLYINNPQDLRIPIDEIIKKYGFDQPFHIQYLNWLGQILRGNLGYSYTANQPVLTAILTKLPHTAEVILFALPIIVILGIFLGIISARNKGGLVDHALKTLATIGWGLPAFWIAMILILIFFSWLNWFPMGVGGRPLSSPAVQFVTSRTSGWKTYTGLFTIDGILNGQLWITQDALRHLVLPTIVLTVGSIAIFMLVVRSGILDRQEERSIAVTPIAGLPPSKVATKVKRRNVALFPANTLSVLLFVSMLSSIIITETIFGLDGLGRWVAEAAGVGGGAPDIAAVVGFMLFWGFTFVIVNLIAEIVYACVEARMR